MDFNICSIEGNRQALDGGAMFGNAPKELWSRWLKPDEKNRVELACRSLLIKAEGATILCEAGIGNFFEPKLAERFGVQDSQRHILLENLKKNNVEEDMIDYVVLSHLHFDHAGGLLSGYEESQKNGQRLLFPNAQYMVGEGAWKRAMNPHLRDKASFIPSLMKLLVESGRLKIFSGNKIPGFFEEFIEFRESSGHTPDQKHLLLKGAKESVFFCGDLVPGTAWLNYPISMGYDRFPEQLIDEKMEILNEAKENNWNLFYTHDPDVSLSKCHLNKKGRVEAKDSQKSVSNFRI